MELRIATGKWYKKKVLLCECKRHTACCVARACFADGGYLIQSWMGGGGGTPSSLGDRRVPHPDLGWPGQGVPHPVLDRGGTPILILDGGTLPVLTWGVPHPVLDGGTPHQQDGVPPPDMGWGTPCPDLGWGTSLSAGWDTPHLDLGWGIPLSGPGMGYPPSRPGMGYLPVSRMGYPPSGSGMGYPPVWTWDGVPPPHPDLGWGTPPPHKCGQTENITFPHPSDAGGKNQ